MSVHSIQHVHHESSHGMLMKVGICQKGEVSKKEEDVLFVWLFQRLQMIHVFLNAFPHNANAETSPFMQDCNKIILQFPSPGQDARTRTRSLSWDPLSRHRPSSSLILCQGPMVSCAS